MTYCNCQLIQDNLKDMFSVIYTPTEGEAIQNFSRLFRKPEGCFLNIQEQDLVYDNLSQWGDPGRSSTSDIRGVCHVLTKP